MNSLAFSLFHSTLRACPQHSKLLVTFLSSQASVENATFRKRKPISKAMRAYIDRVKDFERKHVIESTEYESGKRFLAKIMCEDPETFTDKDVKASIQYLLPSGLFVDHTRPIMEPPQDFVQAPKFDDTGRPYHYLFYTAAPKIFGLQHEAVSRLNKADKLLEQIHRKGHVPEQEDTIDLVGSEWIDKGHLCKMLNDTMRDSDYETLIEVLGRLSQHPMSAHFKDFIMTYRTPIIVELSQMSFPEVQTSEDGRSFVKASARRKHCDADVIVRSPGEGKIVINGTHDLLYFHDLQARQQILFPLEVCQLVGKVDLEVAVEGPGYSSQAGAVRLATSLALASLSDEETRAKLRIAGLFQRDWRNRERKKPGKKGARRGYTWLKR